MEEDVVEGMVESMEQKQGNLIREPTRRYSSSKTGMN
jgi:hypothetical protein